MSHIVPESGSQLAEGGRHQDRGNSPKNLKKKTPWNAERLLPTLPLNNRIIRPTKGLSCSKKNSDSIIDCFGYPPS